MITRRAAIALIGCALLGTVAAADPGRDVIGRVTVKVFFGTDGDPSVIGDKGGPPTPDDVKLLKSCDRLDFAHYREVGRDTKELYRSYENWAEPIRGSDEIMCRFEVADRLSEKNIRLDLEFWLSRKKILKSSVAVSPEKPMLVLGPAWRGGRLIISVEISPESES